MLLWHLLWCVNTNMSVLKNLEVSQGCIYGQMLQEFQVLWMKWWQQLWDMSVAARASGSMEGLSEEASRIRSKEILKFLAQIQHILNFGQLGIFAEISIMKRKLGHWHGGYCGLWIQLLKLCRPNFCPFPQCPSSQLQYQCRHDFFCHLVYLSFESKIYLWSWPMSSIGCWT